MRIFLSLILLLNFGFSAVWSSSSEDGINQAFDEYNNKIKTKNNNIVKRYNEINNGVVDKILKNDELKKELLKRHKILLVDETTEKYGLELEFERLKQLLNNEGTN